MSVKKSKKGHVETLPAKRETGQVLSLTPAEFEEDIVVEDFENLPEEFRNADEVSVDFPPTPTFSKPGQFIAGEYLKSQHEVGPNKSSIYYFETRNKAGKGLKWAMWGSWVIDQFMHEHKPQRGDKVLFIYKGTAPTTRGLNEVKKFEIRMIRGNVS